MCLRKLRVICIVLSSGNSNERKKLSGFSRKLFAFKSFNNQLSDAGIAIVLAFSCIAITWEAQLHQLHGLPHWNLSGLQQLQRLNYRIRPLI